MGFQQPPQLPDYSKLVQYLNSSGVQKWNPAVYDILKQLIGAVQQSQTTIVGTTIPDAAAAVPGFTGVSVDPAGALNGDGTVPSPLAVRVDASTIGINGSNQLSFVAGLPIYVNVSVPIANYRTLFSSPYTIVAAQGSGKYIIPLAAVFQIKKPGGSTGNTSPGIRFFYGPGANRWGQDITPGMNTGFTYWYIFMNQQTGGAIFDPTATPDNQALMLASTFDMGAGTTINSVNIGIVYSVMTFP